MTDPFSVLPVPMNTQNQVVDLIECLDRLRELEEMDELYVSCTNDKKGLSWVKIT